jgi:homoserine O-acetyltransferase
MDPKLYRIEGDVPLERGGLLREPAIAYHMWGKPAADGSNVVWVCHALSGSSDVLAWWPGLFKPGAPLDLEQWCIVCANVPGSCYGSEGPLTPNAATGQPLYGAFPELTVRDVVSCFRLLANYLGIDRVHLLIGGSLGGQQALEWAVQEPSRFTHLVLLATNAVHSPWGVAFNEAQRMAIQADSTFGESHPHAGLEGMKAARAVALLSYRTYHTYANGQSPAGQAKVHPAVTYQRYQGEKLAKRFNAYSYHLLSIMMDSHDVGRGRGGVEEALAPIAAKTLCISIEGDLLFPPIEQQRIAAAVTNASWVCIPSAYGHDGFLVETDAIGKLLHTHLAKAGQNQTCEPQPCNHTNL